MAWHIMALIRIVELAPKKDVEMINHGEEHVKLYDLVIFNIAMENPISMEVCIGKIICTWAVFHGHVK